MDTKEILDKEFSEQKFPEEHPNAEILNRYKEIACNYARMENAIAVLSDLRNHASYISYVRLSQMLGAGNRKKEGKVSSIWEDDIFGLIHPDDLASKHLQELRFFHFIKSQPRRRRYDYYLTSKLRMRNAANSYIPVLHRMFYISAPCDDTLWLALCLYNPLVFEMSAKCVIIDSVNGRTTALDGYNDTTILSIREKQVLMLIDKGLTSKEISETLSISINTVSRHRQEILGKLQVKNSIEACRTAKDLKLI